MGGKEEDTGGQQAESVSGSWTGVGPRFPRSFSSKT